MCVKCSIVKMQRHLIVLLVLFDPMHCVFRSERLLCSNGATVNVAVSASSNQNASLRAAELGGRLPTSTEVREIIFSLGGPLFHNQVWIPVSENDFVQVGVKKSQIPASCSQCEEVGSGMQVSLKCSCLNQQKNPSKTMIIYSNCVGSEILNF